MTFYRFFDVSKTALLLPFCPRF